ncbi:transposase family protein, partial [Kitasatospora sp. NPDC007106]|uniref:transposase family protein n=1 Tax=Kitasatospora sp. NPDC007106 TaxID=3156914 RepID=UPI0034018434
MSDVGQPGSVPRLRKLVQGVHGSYLRFPADLPVAGRRVVLQLRVRRFKCEDVSCGRRTFVEQVADLARRHSQRTERMRSVL